VYVTLFAAPPPVEVIVSIARAGLSNVTGIFATRVQFKSVAQGVTAKIIKIRRTVAHANPKRGRFFPNGRAKITAGANGRTKTPLDEHT
jgi:hypothetical protein